MKISKKIQKIVTVGAIATTLFATAPIGLMTPTALAAETAETYGVSGTPIDLGGMIVTPMIPSQIPIGQDTVITVKVEWIDEPGYTNMLAASLTVDGDAQFISMGVKGDYGLPISAAGKRINYINDRDGGYDSTTLVIHGNTEGTATVTGTFTFGTSVQDPEIDPVLITKPVTFTLNMVDMVSLQAEKDKAKDEIDKLPNLTDDEKDDFKGQVDDATTVPEIDKIVDAAKDRDRENAAKNLEDAKKAAKERIDALPNLSADEKTGYKNQVDGATTIPEINRIVDAAVAKDAANLAAAKVKGKAEVDEMDHLNQSEKDDFKGQIDGATTIVRVEEIVELAKQKNQQNSETNLSDAKDKAKETIDGLPNLTPAEKDDFKNQVDGATSVPQIDAIVDAAKEKDKANLDAAKEKAKEEINGMEHLNQDEKDGFNDRIDDATTIPQIDKIVEEARDKDQQNKEDQDLQKEKDKAKDVIDGLPNLTDEEKNKAKDEIDDSKTQDKIDNIVDKNKELDEEREKEKQLQLYRDKAKAEIDALLNLSDEEKAGYKAEVDGSKTQSKIDRIVEEAKEQDAENLLNAKNKGKKEINSLPDLSDKEKADFIAQIDEAVTIVRVEEIVEAAKAQNDANHVIPGDMNQDGRLSLVDIMLLKQYLLDGSIPSKYNAAKFEKAADVNQDGNITLMDYMILKKLVLDGEIM